MAKTETEFVEREVRIRAAPDTIFSFFTDPEKVVRWHGLSATLDPRPEGVFQVNVIASHTARGEFVEVEPPAPSCVHLGLGRRRCGATRVEHRRGHAHPGWRGHRRAPRPPRPPG